MFLELAPAVVNNRLYQARKRLRKDLLAMAIEDLQSQRSSKDERFGDNVVGQTSSSDLVHGAGPGAGWLRPTRSIVIIGLEITMEGIEYGILNPTNRNPQGESKCTSGGALLQLRGGQSQRVVTSRRSVRDQDSRSPRWCPQEGAYERTHPRLLCTPLPVS